jgi:MoaA/NifB/PqqE/SkfB family radical SAM enzyme
MAIRFGTSSLLSFSEALRLSVSSPRCVVNAVHDKLFGNRSLKFPRRVILHLTNRCNFACPMCGIAEARANRLKDCPGDTPFEVVERVIAEAGKYACYVELFGGEPTLYERLGDTIALLNKHRLLSYITTNGFNLRERAREIVGSGLKILTISMDGWDEASSYERGRVRGSFEAIREGIAEINRIRRGMFPIIRIASIITKANYKQFDKIADAIYSMGVRRWVVENYFFITDGAVRAHKELKASSGIGDNLTQHHISGIDSYFDRSEIADLKESLARTRTKVSSRYRDMRVDSGWNLDLDAYYSPRRPALSSSCAAPFSRIDVNPGGRISSCLDGHTIGDVLHGSIYEAWNGKERKKLLDLLARQKVLPMCFRCCEIQRGLKFDHTSLPY